MAAYGLGQKEAPQLEMRQCRGQALVLNLMTLSFVLLVVTHVVKTGEVLIERQQSRLAIDLTALSAARAEGELLTLVSVINDVMVKEAQLAIASVAAPIFAAATIIGLPLVPHLAKVAAQVVPRALKSIERLGRIKQRVIQMAPVLIQTQTLKIARDNGLRGAVVLPLKKLPLSPDPERSFERVLDFSRYIGDTSIPNLNPAEIKKILNDPSKQITRAGKNEDPARQKADKALGRIDRLKHNLRRQLPVLSFLDKRWQDRTMTVVALDKDNNVLVASARAIHSSFAHDSQDYLTHPDNLLTGPTVNAGPGELFQPTLMPVPSLFGSQPHLQKIVKKLETFLDRLPEDSPLGNEHARWIHH